MGEFCKPNNRNCGLYYANAIWLLKESEGMSGAITNKEMAYKINQEVFAETLKNLKKLKLIVTLGEHSFNFIKHFFKKLLFQHFFMPHYYYFSCRRLKTLRRPFRRRR